MSNITLPLVPFDTAKLLKEKGFDVPTNKWYHNPSKGLYRGQIGLKHSIDDWNHRVIDVRFNAPSLALVCEWLRGKHGLHVYAMSTNSNKEYHIRICSNSGDITALDIPYSNHTEALTAAINHALTLIP